MFTDSPLESLLSILMSSHPTTDVSTSTTLTTIPGIVRKLKAEAKEDSDPECIAGTFLRLEIPHILSKVPLQRHDRSYALYTDQDILWWRKVPEGSWPAHFSLEFWPNELECGNCPCCSSISMIVIVVSLQALCTGFWQITNHNVVLQNLLSCVVYKPHELWIIKYIVIEFPLKLPGQKARP